MQSSISLLHGFVLAVVALTMTSVVISKPYHGENDGQPLAFLSQGCMTSRARDAVFIGSEFVSMAFDLTIDCPS
jgi:hypothetical protein